MATSPFSLVDYYTIDVDCSQTSQSQSGNYSDVFYRIIGHRNGGSQGYWSGENSGNTGEAFRLGGTQIWDGTNLAFDFRDTDDIVFRSGTIRVNHDADGYAQIAVSGRLTLNNLGTAAASSGTKNLTRIPKKPSPPGRPAASDIRATSMDLTWAASNDTNGSPIDGYLLRMWEAASDTGPYTNVSTAMSLSRTVTGLEAGKTYTFAVFAHNDSADNGGFSEPSAIRTITTPTKPSKPGKPTASELLPQSLRVSWTASASNGGNAIDRYKLRRWANAEGTGPYVDSDELNLTRFVSGLTPGTTYRFVVYAHNNSGDGDSFSDPSDPLTVRMLAGGRVRVEGEYRQAIVYVKVEGEYRMALPYVRVEGEWRLAN